MKATTECPFCRKQHVFHSDTSGDWYMCLSCQRSGKLSDLDRVQCPDFLKDLFGLFDGGKN